MRGGEAAGSALREGCAGLRVSVCVRLSVCVHLSGVARRAGQQTRPCWAVRCLRGPPAPPGASDPPCALGWVLQGSPCENKGGMFFHALALLRAKSRCAR